jgi:hypothetical protein
MHEVNQQKSIDLTCTIYIYILLWISKLLEIPGQYYIYIIRLKIKPNSVFLHYIIPIEDFVKL